MKLLGAIIGALLGLALMYAISSALYDPPYDSYDILTPILLLLAHGIAAIIGWITGYDVADRHDRKPPAAGSRDDGKPRGAAPRPTPREGSSRSDDGWDGAFRPVLKAGLIIAVIPVLIVFGLQPFLHLHKFLDPGPNDSPLSRSEWIARKSRHYNADPTRLDATAAFLAREVKGCIGRNRLVSADAIDALKSCRDMLATWNALPADSLAALGAYQDGDWGMRWTLDEDRDPSRVVVVADALLEIEGDVPVYEITTGRIVRRANANAPSFAVDSSVAAIARTFDCFESSAAALRQSGEWNGDLLELAALIVDHEPVRGCYRLHFSRDPLPHHREWAFDPGAFRFRLHHEPAGFQLLRNGGPLRTKYQLIAAGNEGVQYMREENGTWHMRHGREPELSDPAPEACLIDLATPCD